MFSCSHDLLDSVSWQVVYEEGKEKDEEHKEEYLDDGPLEVVPEYIFDRLHWVQEPNEGGVRSAA